VVSDLLTDTMPSRQNVCKLIITWNYNTGDSLLLKNIKGKQQVGCSRCSGYPAVQHVLDLYFNTIITNPVFTKKRNGVTVQIPVNDNHRMPILIKQK